MVLWSRCRGVDLGSGLRLTALHCADLLPGGAQVVVRGVVPRKGGTGAFDYVIARLPNWRRSSPLPCRSTRFGYLLGRPVRISAPDNSLGAGLAVLDAPGRKGLSGAPILADDGAPVSIVVGIDRDGRPVAIAPGVVCGAVELARRKADGGT